MGRQDARTTAMHCLYQMDIHGTYSDDQLLQGVSNSMLNKNDKEYVIKLGGNFLQHATAVDEVIQNYLKDDWKIDRISKVELAILRIAVTEILYEDIPNRVVINEAVELAKKFSDESSSSFINGLLGTWLRSKA